MTLKYTSRELQTRLEKECDLLFQVTCCESQKKITKLIQNATEEQIAAIIEVVANISLFTCPPGLTIQCDYSFDTTKIIPTKIKRTTDFRKNILKNWKLVRSILAEAADEIYLCEANKYVLWDMEDDASVRSDVSS